MKEFSLFVFSTLSKRISLWRYPSGIWLVFVFILDILATNTLDREAEPIELLFKNETTLKTANHSFLANFLDSLPLHEPMMPRSLVAISNNDSIRDIAYFDESVKNCFINRCISIDSFGFFYTLQRMTFPYAPVVSELPTFSNFENDGTYNKNIKECVFLLEGIYTSVFNQVATDYCLNESVPDDETISNKIHEVLETSLNKLFILQPTIVNLLILVPDLRNKILNDIQLREMLKRSKMEIFTSEIIYKKIGKRIPKLSDILWPKNPKKYSSNQTWEKLLDMLQQYERVYVSLFGYLEYSAIENSLLKTNRIDQIKNEIDQLYEDIRKLPRLMNLNNISNVVSEELEFCISQWLCNVAFLKLLCAKMLEYMDYFEKFKKLESFLQEKFFGRLEERFRYINQECEQIIWIPDLMTKSLSYVWETARKIDMCPEYSQIIIDDILKKLSVDGKFYDSFFKHYNCALPGLVKSICDRTPERWAPNADLPPVKDMVARIQTQKCGIEELRLLYFGVKKGNDKGCYLNWYADQLLRKLKREGVKDYKHFNKDATPSQIIAMYAIHIIKYDDSSNEENQADFSKRFIAVYRYMLDLKDHISALNSWIASVISYFFNL